MSNMQIHRIAIERAIQLLTAAGCQFAIIDADGGKHGTLEAHAAPRRRPSQFKRGTFVSHFKPFIDAIQAGQAAVIPFGPFAVNEPAKVSLQKAISSHCSSHWGNKTYITHMNAAGVEVLRLE